MAASPDLAVPGAIPAGQLSAPVAIGLGICTYNRPEFFERCVAAIGQHCAPIVDGVYVYNDGSDTQYDERYARAYATVDAEVVTGEQNRGVAFAKNALIEMMLRDGHEWLFLCEDDHVVLSPEAVTGYLRVAQQAGLHHLSFAHHSPSNLRGVVEVAGDVVYYRYSFASWCLYSRAVIEDVGAFDTEFVNVLEHVEWEMRAYLAGYDPKGGPNRYADARHSKRWVAEMRNSYLKSSIRRRPDWQEQNRRGMRYWYAHKPESFRLLFGELVPD